jgi:DNA-binding NtrC family response regulator
MVAPFDAAGEVAREVALGDRAGSSGGAPTRDAAPDGDYLVVFQTGASSVVGVPDEGELVVGSSEVADVVVRGPGVSSRHARLEAREGALHVEPIGAAARVLVNDEPVSAPRRLASGDAIGIGPATIVVHRDRRRASRRVLAGEAELAARLAEEAARATRYGRPLAIVSIDLGQAVREPREALAAAALEPLRRSDVVACAGSSELVVLLPETAGAATVPATRVLAAIAPFAPRARAGLALCPDDASDADALLTAARSAARVARVGEVGGLARAAAALDAGGRAIVVADPSMRRVYELVRRLAPSDLPVLVLGETGVGKEAVAAALHAWSPRAPQPFVAINCAALPEPLIESELFGHERGAFTGAAASKPGLLEGAHGGTVLLDEIGELPAGAQAKLLRVLETRCVLRVGATRERPIDVRVVAATNRPLDAEVDAGRFRRDLYFRLAAAAVFLPPLRDRPLDLPVLARAFLDEACERLGRARLSLAPDAQGRLARHAWPGNVRELKNAMEYVAATAARPIVEEGDLPPAIGGGASPWARPSPGSRPARGAPEPASPRATSLQDELRALERRRILEALDACDGVRVRAAAFIGMPLRTFVTRLRDHGIGPSEGRRAQRGA